MTIELPDVDGVDPAEVRLELACALYQRGHVGKVGGAELAGINFFDFQRALGEREIESCTTEMLDADLANLDSLLKP